MSLLAKLECPSPGNGTLAVACNNALQKWESIPKEILVSINDRLVPIEEANIKDVSQKSKYYRIENSRLVEINV